MKRKQEEISVFDICNLVKAEIRNSADSFVSIGYWLKEIKGRELYRETGHKDIWEFAFAQFGFSKSTASRFMRINDKFSIGGNSPELEDKYKNLSSSQLSEMLTLSESQITQVKAETTVKEIRAMKPKKEKKRDMGIVQSEECLDCMLNNNPDAGIMECHPETGEHKCYGLTEEEEEAEKSVATSQQKKDIEPKQKIKYANPAPTLPDGWYRRVPLGKMDCEGKEIHEGDILESQIDSPAGIFYVVWHPRGVAFRAVLPKHVQLDGTAEDNIAYISSDLWDETRIIGSIYDSWGDEEDEQSICS